MARMYSRKKGKSGSKKPSKIIKPAWVRYSDQEVEQLVVKLAKQDKSTSLIGMILRDSYGIPDVKIITNKKINQILKDHKLPSKLPEDLKALIIKEIRLTKHLELNRKDFTVKRGQQITESKIKKLAKYYINTKVLPADWKYDRAKAKLLIE